MPKVVSLGDVLIGDIPHRLICTISPLGELLLQYVNLSTGAIAPEALSMDACAGYELHLHLAAFHQGQYAEEMKTEDA